ncbi:MAG: GNAT family N-acetyltransferase [Oscillospiraceae bacterium]|nr:GNAT family N-acetyltransferase [Oscillospiraceae bacterium]
MSMFSDLKEALVPEFRALWKKAFGDDDVFLDSFFSTAFAPHRGRCILEEGRVRAVLYWFDVSCEDRKLAYVYAVATAPDYRGRGLCRALVEDTKEILKTRGYDGILLVPQEENLIRLYEKLGFSPCTEVSEFVCGPQIPAVPLHKVDASDYALRRRALLPQGGVIQEDENLAFLQTQAEFCIGPGFAAAINTDGDKLHCMELVGDPGAAPGIVMALGCTSGFFRCPGKGKPFSMLYPLTANCPAPTYFGLAFD